MFVMKNKPISEEFSGDRFPDYRKREYNPKSPEKENKSQTIPYVPFHEKQENQIKKKGGRGNLPLSPHK